METDITRQDIVALCISKKKIPLIKVYREVTGEGLKVSKEAVEQHIHPDPNGQSGYHNLVYDSYGMVNMFLPFIESSDFDGIRQDINEGVKVALENHYALGFSEPFEAVRMVIANLEKNYKDKKVDEFLKS